MFVGKYLGFPNLPDVGIGKFFVGDIGRHQAGVLIVEKRVDDVPGELCAVEAVSQSGTSGAFREHLAVGLPLRGARHEPGTDIFQVDG